MSSSDEGRYRRNDGNDGVYESDLMVQARTDL